MADTLRIGHEGEEAATEFLRREGYLIVERNWRNGKLEIDIVAERCEELHFVEVKTRRADGLTTPEDAITPHKVKTLVRAINSYVEQHGVECDVVLDLLAVDQMPDGSYECRMVPDIANLNW